MRDKATMTKKTATSKKQSSKPAKVKKTKTVARPVIADIEHLSKKHLDMLKTPIATTVTKRPESSFIDLMNWAVENFVTFAEAGHPTTINKFVHNRIMIDGQFLTFAEENDIDVEMIWKDSIISWRHNKDFEKFFAQGVFRVTTKDCEFLHCSLYHKGNANEDEVSFFNLVTTHYADAYLKLRNQYDDWATERDRKTLSIKVIGGDDIPYTRTHFWQDLFMPEKMKSAIKSTAENFLSSKDFYEENSIPWKRGILLHGKPGNGKSSLVKTLISEYDFKPVTVGPGASTEDMVQAFKVAESLSPALLYIEDLDSLFDRGVDTSTFLNLMDGVESKNGLLIIATANNIKKLKANITDRPSRFDRKWEVPLPSEDMATLYLQKWFKMLNLAKIKVLAKKAVAMNLSYAYLKELYISAMFEALAHNRKAPTDQDIDRAIEDLLKDKNLLNKAMSMSRYLKE